MPLHAKFYTLAQEMIDCYGPEAEDHAGEMLRVRLAGRQPAGGGRLAGHRQRHRGPGAAPPAGQAALMRPLTCVSIP